jgi:hypothetical protein
VLVTRAQGARPLIVNPRLLIDGIERGGIYTEQRNSSEMSRREREFVSEGKSTHARDGRCSDRYEIRGKVRGSSEYGRRGGDGSGYGKSRRLDDEDALAADMAVNGGLL